MTLNEYQNLAMMTANKELDILDLTLDGLMGLNGEAGECIDIMKKYLYQGHELDIDGLFNELGDVLWYLAITVQALGTDMEYIAERTIAKLRKRYPNGFETERSINREEV